MIVVGLTGSMATGKSLVAGMMAQLGAVVIDADDIARRAVARGSAALEEIVARFGSEVLGSDGKLDRKAMRRLIFGNPEAKADLEGIVHPRVMALQEEMIRAAGEADPEAVVVVDIPLLYEVEAVDRFDLVVVAYADRQTQVARLMARDGYHRDEAYKAIANQIDIEEKKRLADKVIDNRHDPETTRRQVDELYTELKRRATAGP